MPHARGHTRLVADLLDPAKKHEPEPTAANMAALRQASEFWPANMEDGNLLAPPTPTVPSGPPTLSETREHIANCAASRRYTHRLPFEANRARVQVEDAQVLHLDQLYMLAKWDAENPDPKDPPVRVHIEAVPEALELLFDAVDVMKDAADSCELPADRRRLLDCVKAIEEHKRFLVH